MAGNQTDRITITLPKQLIEELEQYAKQDYSTRSDMIRLALLQYLRQLPPLMNYSKGPAADQATLGRLQREKLARYLEQDLREHPKAA